MSNVYALSNGEKQDVLASAVSRLIELTEFGFWILWVCGSVVEVTSSVVVMHSISTKEFDKVKI